MSGKKAKNSIIGKWVSVESIHGPAHRSSYVNSLNFKEDGTFESTNTETVCWESDYVSPSSTIKSQTGLWHKSQTGFCQFFLNSENISNFELTSIQGDLLLKVSLSFSDSASEMLQIHFSASNTGLK